MKYILLLAATAVAIPRPWTRAELSYPTLGRRHIALERRGKGATGRNSPRAGPNVASNPNTHRSNQQGSQPPPKDAWAVSVLHGAGTVSATTGKREKETPNKPDVDRIKSGSDGRKEVHDRLWSSATSISTESTPEQAHLQPAGRHASRVQGSGMAAHVEVDPAGGYGHIKKTINGEVFNRKVLPTDGKVVDMHFGDKPGEVSYDASATAGGTTHITTSNR